MSEAPTSSSSTEPAGLLLGSVAWERAGGPALSAGQRLAVLGGAGVVVASHLASLLCWRLRLSRRPPKVDLTRWAPPDSRAAREAEDCVRAMSTPEMAHHCFRTYWFSAIQCELASMSTRIDREALYVAALMHDVSFGAARPPNEHCFTVGCARELRRVTAVAGWAPSRQDRAALAVTTNPSPLVPYDTFGLEAHFMSLGGRVEILAQEWLVNGENLDEILAKHPRIGFTGDALTHYRREIGHDPGGRFACLNPMFPLLVGRSEFSAQ